MLLMSLGEWLGLGGLLFTAAGFVWGVAAWSIGRYSKISEARKEDSKQAAKENFKILTESVERVNTTMTNVQIEHARTDESTKSAHKRLDKHDDKIGQIEKKIDL